MLLNKRNVKAGAGQNDRAKADQKQERKKWEEANHRWKAASPPPSKGELPPRRTECECDLKGADTRRGQREEQSGGLCHRLERHQEWYV